MYDSGKYDMAGFCVGVVEYDNMLPKVNEIKPGDIVIGLPSSGVHSNGFSLVHRILNIIGKTYNDIAPFSDKGNTIGKLQNLMLYLSILGYKS